MDVIKGLEDLKLGEGSRIREIKRSWNRIKNDPHEVVIYKEAAGTRVLGVLFD